MKLKFNVTGMEGSVAKIEMSRVDEQHNNAVLNPPCTELTVTDKWETALEDNEFKVAFELPRYGFAALSIDVE